MPPRCVHRRPKRHTWPRRRWTWAPREEGCRRSASCSERSGRGHFRSYNAHILPCCRSRGSRTSPVPLLAGAAAAVAAMPQPPVRTHGFVQPAALAPYTHYQRHQHRHQHRHPHCHQRPLVRWCAPQPPCRSAGAATAPDTTVPQQFGRPPSSSDARICMDTPLVVRRPRLSARQMPRGPALPVCGCPRQRRRSTSRLPGQRELRQAAQQMRGFSAQPMPTACLSTFTPRKTRRAKHATHRCRCRRPGDCIPCRSSAACVRVSVGGRPPHHIRLRYRSWCQYCVPATPAATTTASTRCAGMRHGSSDAAATVDGCAATLRPAAHAVATARPCAQPCTAFQRAAPHPCSTSGHRLVIVLPLACLLPVAASAGRRAPRGGRIWQTAVYASSASHRMWPPASRADTSSAANCNVVTTHATAGHHTIPSAAAASHRPPHCWAR